MNRAVAMESCDTSVDSEEYLQPKMQMPGCSNMIGVPISNSPLPSNWDRFSMGHVPARVFTMKGQ